MLQKLTTVLKLNTSRYYATVAAVKSAKPRQKRAPATQETPYITCKRADFNLLQPTNHQCAFGTIPLASKGWLHNKSKGDHFTINATVTEEQLQAEMQAVSEFTNTTGHQISPELVKNLKNELDIEQLTSIQTNGIPKIYDSHHTLLAAETGCGKTLAYLLPIVQRVLQTKQAESGKAKQRDLNTPLVVVITPGRELATQISNVAEKLCKSMDLRVKAVLGGNTKQLMVNPEFADVDILVATIGALSKLTTTGIYRMQEVRHVVLDEADTLLDDSFSDKLCHFLRRFPFHKNHMQDEHSVGTQLVLASATMPTNIEQLLQKIVDVQTIHQIVSPNLHKLMAHVVQKFQRMNKADRPANLLCIVKQELAKKRPLIVFSNKSATCDFVSIFLNNSGVQCLNLNGDMLMKIRIGRFEEFQRGHCDVLSTTDVGSRGLDTTRARHVINFDFPLHVSDYIHRCGRIGRVGNMQKSLVTNFISSRREIDIVQRIEHAARTGSLLPNVNANIKNIINQRIMGEMKAAGMSAPEEAF